MSEQHQELLHAWQDLLNQQIRESGEIQRGNPHIWRALHLMDNHIWWEYLTACEQHLRGRYAQDAVWDLITELQTALTKYQHQYVNVITPYPREQRCRPQTYLRSAWRLIMRMREILNEDQGIVLKNG